MAVWCAIAVAVFAADQLTKWWIASRLEPGEGWPIIPGFFNLVHWHNTGAAWGTLQGLNTLLIVVSLIVLVVLVRWRHKLHWERPGARVATALLAGGITGNLVDRVRLGAVVDFLDFYIDRWHWPAFNVADSAICVGVALYILSTWRADPPAAPVQSG